MPPLWQTIVTAVVVVLLGLGSSAAYWARGALRDQENPTGSALLLPLFIATVACVIGVFLIGEPTVWRGLIWGVAAELIIGIGGLKYLGRPN